MIDGEAMEMPPDEDELPYSDGAPMDSQQHGLQIELLRDALQLYCSDRPDVFIGGDMAVYYSLEQADEVIDNGATGAFRAPDFFVALGAKSHRLRKSWLTWKEGKAPNVIIELLSESTANTDKTEKKLIYQDLMRVPEYFLYAPNSTDLVGYILRNGEYAKIKPEHERLPSKQLKLTLVVWYGSWASYEATWLRWAMPDGTLLPTGEERAAEAEARAEQAKAKAAEAQAKAAEAQAKTAEAQAETRQTRQELDRERRRAEALAAKLRGLGINPDDIE